MNSAQYASQAAVRRVLDELGIRSTRYALDNKSLTVLVGERCHEVSLRLPLCGTEEDVLNLIRGVFQ